MNETTQNEGAITRAIQRYEGAATISEIASIVGLSQSTVRKGVQALVRSGSLVELGVSATGGRCYGVRK